MRHSRATDVFGAACGRETWLAYTKQQIAFGVD